MHRADMIHMGSRMAKGTSCTLAREAGSWPKKTAWVTLMKEARVITDTTTATMVMKA